MDWHSSGITTAVAVDRLVDTSRLVAKVDSAAVQDRFAPYLHGFVVTDDGVWTVVHRGTGGGRHRH